LIAPSVFSSVYLSCLIQCAGYMAEAFLIRNKTWTLLGSHIKIGKLICTILDFAISNNFLDSSLLQFNIYYIYKKYTVKTRKVSSHVYLNRFSLLLPFSIGIRTVSTILYFCVFYLNFIVLKYMQCICFAYCTDDLSQDFFCRWL
jgi:hypothetical protein